MTDDTGRTDATIRPIGLSASAQAGEVRVVHFTLVSPKWVGYGVAALALGGLALLCAPLRGIADHVAAAGVLVLLANVLTAAQKALIKHCQKCHPLLRRLGLLDD